MEKSTDLKIYPKLKNVELKLDSFLFHFQGVNLFQFIWPTFWKIFLRDQIYDPNP